MAHKWTNFSKREHFLQGAKHCCEEHPYPHPCREYNMNCTAAANRLKIGVPATTFHGGHQSGEEKKRCKKTHTSGSRPYFYRTDKRSARDRHTVSAQIQQSHPQGITRVPRCAALHHMHGLHQIGYHPVAECFYLKSR